MLHTSDKYKEEEEKEEEKIQQIDFPIPLYHHHHPSHTKNDFLKYLFKLTWINSAPLPPMNATKHMYISYYK